MGNTQQPVNTTGQLADNRAHPLHHRGKQSRHNVSHVFRLLVCLGIIICMLIPATLGSANDDDRSLTIHDVTIEAALDESGHLHVQQTMDYSFRGAHNGILWAIGTRGASSIENIEAYAYQNGTREALQVEQEQDGSTVHLRIHRPVEDERVSFELHYQLNDVAISYDDTADLEWSFIDGRNEYDFEQFAMKIVLPHPLHETDIDLFPRLPDDAQINIHNERIDMSVQPLEAGEEAGFRLLFPTHTIPNNENVEAGAQYEAIVIKEGDGTAAYWLRFLYTESTVGNIIEVLLIVLLLPLFLIYLLYRLMYTYYYGKQATPFRGQTYETLPADITPAVAGQFMYQALNQDHLAATLLDLARKGAISIQIDESQRKKKGNKKDKQSGKNTAQDRSNETEQDIRFQRVDDRISVEDTTATDFQTEHTSLFPHEQHVLDWLFSDVAKNGTFTASMLQTYTQKNEMAFHKQWDKWQTAVKERLNEFNYLQKNNGALLFFIIGALIAAISIAGMFMYETVHVFGAFLFGLGVFCHGFFYFGKTEKGYAEWTKWKGYIRYLRNIKRVEKKIDIRNQPMEHHFIYAVSFGISESLFNQVDESFEQLVRQHPYLTICHPTYLTLLQTSIHSSSTSSTTSTTSASRGGGGAGGSF